jgi:hypothetical protein
MEVRWFDYQECAFKEVGKTLIPPYSGLIFFLFSGQ